jgi:hypothetical protein
MLSEGLVARAEIPSMMATLCSYENCFGPYHPQTLALMTEVAAAFWRNGDARLARRLLERVIASVAPECEMRARAFGLLSEILLASPIPE